MFYMKIFDVNIISCLSKAYPGKFDIAFNMYLFTFMFLQSFRREFYNRNLIFITCFDHMLGILFMINFIKLFVTIEACQENCQKILK